MLAELHTAYRGICAYSCHWIPYDTGADTVEHFKPKSRYPARAYDWSNYRLVSSTLNGRKQDREDILDPFLIKDGWFVLDFPSLLVKASADLPSEEAAKVEHTRDVLGLNDEGTCLKARVRYVRQLCEGIVTFAYLQQDAPFIAKEIERQKLRRRIRTIMGY